MYVWPSTQLWWNYFFHPDHQEPNFLCLAGWVWVGTWTAQSWLSVNPSKPAFTHQIPSSHTTHTYLPFHHIHLFGHSNPRERSNGVDSVIDWSVKTKHILKFVVELQHKWYGRTIVNSREGWENSVSVCLEHSQHILRTEDKWRRRRRRRRGGGRRSGGGGRDWMELSVIATSTRAQPDLRQRLSQLCYFLAALAALYLPLVTD